MPSKVFISCGQREDQEKEFARKIKEFIKEKGYEPILSSEMHTLEGVNECLISALDKADFYLFIDLVREEVFGNKNLKYRGSLYTHQELAWAYLLRIDKVIYLQQEKDGFKSEGLLAYWLHNPLTFKDVILDENLKIELEKKMEEEGWLPTFSRHLEIILKEKPPRYHKYFDHYNKPNKPVEQFIWKAEIHNHRNDKPAQNCMGFLWQIKRPSGKIEDSPDKSNLKWSNRKEAYSGFIRPNDFSELDLFAISFRNPNRVYLHSDSDFYNNDHDYPREPIISEVGTYELTYRIYAENFPMLEFLIKLNNAGNWPATEASLFSENSNDEGDACFCVQKSKTINGVSKPSTSTSYGYSGYSGTFHK